MKITDVKLSEPIYIPFRQMADAINVLPTAMTCTFLQISTDGGITGITPAGGGALSKVLIEGVLKAQVIGEDPLNTERIWDKMYWATLLYHMRGAEGDIDVFVTEYKRHIAVASLTTSLSTRWWLDYGSYLTF